MEVEVEVEVSLKKFKLNDNYLKFKNCLINKCLEYKGLLVFDGDAEIFELFILPILNGEILNIKTLESHLFEKFNFVIKDILSYINQCLLDELNYFNIYTLKLDNLDLNHNNNIIIISNLISHMHGIYSSLLQIELYISLQKDKKIISVLINNIALKIPDKIIMDLCRNIGYGDVKIEKMDIESVWTPSPTTNNVYIEAYFDYIVSDDGTVLEIRKGKEKKVF